MKPRDSVAGPWHRTLKGCRRRALPSPAAFQAAESRSVGQSPGFHPGLGSLRPFRPPERPHSTTVGRVVRPIVKRSRRNRIGTSRAAYRRDPSLRTASTILWLRGLLQSAIRASPLSMTFTFELALAGSPRTNVEYDYVGKQSIPTTGLSPASPSALWAAEPSLTLGPPSTSITTLYASPSAAIADAAATQARAQLDWWNATVHVYATSSSSG